MKMELASAITKVKSKREKLLYSAAGFLAGAGVIGGVAPFGVAMLCAAPKKHRAAVFAGVAVSAFFDECIPLAVFCAAYVFFILYLREKQGGVYLYTRILLAVSVSALRAAYIAASGVSTTGRMFALIFAAVSHPLAAYAFRGYFDAKKEVRRRRYEIALLTFAFAFTCSAARFDPFGVSAALFPAAVFTLCAARSRGFAFGGACGVVCGLACGGAATGALGVMGMTYGFLCSEAEPLAAVLSFMLAACGYYYLAGAETAVAAGAIIAVACAAFFPFRKKVAMANVRSTYREKFESDRRISRFAAAFSSLSSLLYTVSGKAETESVSELNRRIKAAVDERCAHCEGCELDKIEIANFFTREIRQNGVVTYAALPKHIAHGCPNVSETARAVNALSAVRAVEGERGLKRMADEYSSFSTILLEAADRQESDRREDKPAAKKVKTELHGAGVECDGVKVTGDRLREVTVFGVHPDRIKSTAKEISAAVGNALGARMSEPEFLLRDDYILMKTHTVPRMRVEYAKLTEAKNGEKVCGDTVNVFESDDKRFYCLLSDGMGSGRDAALSSRLAAIMIEKLITVGADKESALKLLNKALTEKDKEVFATVDLLEIDRVLGRATIIKAGAAPTYLVRDGAAEEIESRTPPAGIMRQVIAEKRSFEVRRGDMIVMMSDGIWQTGSDGTLLPESGIPPMPSAQALAAKIMRDARLRGESADDMSVCVMRIC